MATAQAHGSLHALRDVREALAAGRATLSEAESDVRQYIANLELGGRSLGRLFEDPWWKRHLRRRYAKQVMALQDALGPDKKTDDGPPQRL